VAVVEQMATGHRQVLHQAVVAQVQQQVVVLVRQVQLTLVAVAVVQVMATVRMAALA
jgi:hypothetical protein